MKILSIETSCDETALCVMDAKSMPADRRSNFNNAKFEILGESLLSQIEKHKEFGGVFPSLAKREHSKNLTPIFEKVLKEAGLYKKSGAGKIKGEKLEEIKKILEKEPELYKKLNPLLSSIEKPKIDKIAVTAGPGLEPALWVGINFAKALSFFWDIPIIPVNHMEGHIFSALLSKQSKNDEEKIFELKSVKFPAVALLISGGHTELILMKPACRQGRKWNSYEKIGETRDDAVGEAFDKVARMLGLEYPGGPEISALAEQARKENMDSKEIDLPRPMINSGNLDFSFSGIKTAVLYKIKKIENLNEKLKMKIALEFENAVTEVLVEKTKKAIKEHRVKTFILGGGVSANKHIRKSFQSLEEDDSDVKVLMPETEFSTDNAIMIGIAGYFNYLKNNKKNQLLYATGLDIKANGNLRIDSKEHSC